MELFNEFTLLQVDAETELLLPEENDNGNTEYKFKFDAPNMARVEHLTTQMAFRLNEGNGTAYYQIGVLDSGQVTGLNEAEILETLLVLYYMSTTFKPKAQVSVQKVRVGHKGHSVMLKVMKAQVSTNKNFTAELEDIKAHYLEESKEEAECTTLRILT